MPYVDNRQDHPAQLNPSKVGLIQTLMGEMARELSTQEGIVGHLRERLAPMLAANICDKVEVREPVPEELGVLAADLFVVINRIRESNARLHLLSSALQL